MVTICHNPRCTKSRQTLSLLIEKGFEPNIVLYLQSPPSAKDIQTILSKLDLSARDLIRSKEAAYTEANLDNNSLSQEALINAMCQNPMLIERPIVICGDKAALGRPPENVLSILPR